MVDLPAHLCAVVARAEKPYRFWALCTNGDCLWTGEPRRTSIIAQADGNLHRLLHCEHPMAEFVNGDTGTCQKCGAPVAIENVNGRHMIVTVPDA